MPAYCYRCLRCDYKWVQIQSSPPEESLCSIDLSKGVRDYQAELPAHHRFVPYLDHHLTKDPKGVWIESREQKKRLMNEQGVVEVGNESLSRPGVKPDTKKGTLFFGNGMPHRITADEDE